MSVVSQNLFAYLGNDDEGDGAPPAPVKTVEKTSTHTSKRNVEPTAPVKGTGSTGNRRGPGGNEGAFRDRNAGHERNQARSAEEGGRGGSRGGAAARVRGGRGSRHPRDRDDRHSKSTPQGGSDKQAAASWGAQDGDAELKDEKAGDAIAKSEQREALAEDAAGEEAEPEDKSLSYADYLAQQAEKKLALEDSLKLRGANEGSKLDKKWQDAKPLEKSEEDYFTATGGKKQREREKKVKQTVDFDPRFVEPERPRGGRGGARGDSRGGARGARGGPRGGRGGERGRGNTRGGRGGREGAAPINTRDESAFPSLGGK